MMCCCDQQVSEAMASEGARIIARISAFARTLRENSFSVGVRETEDAARLVGSDVGRRADHLRHGLKALFCGSHAQWSKFDAIFDAFWLATSAKPSVRTNVPSKAAEGTSLRDLASGAGGALQTPSLGDQAPQDEGKDGDQSGLGRMEGASQVANLAEADLRKIHDPEAMAAAHRLAERLARRMRMRLTRRFRVSNQGRRIDLRRTIRRSIGSGGVPVHPVQLRRRQKPLRLVILLDVSGSMSQYTSVFVRFVHGVLTHVRKSEAFLIHTSLVHVSPALAERDPGRALDRLSLMAQGAGGGTRIGECLADFNKWHARRVLDGRTCVMVLSDGYDTGSPELLGAEMRRMARRCRRIVWLNPMIGWEGYEPKAQGMQAALPHIDLFAPAHSLRSLEALAPYLARI
ncbi:MAG: VWA domain-containing protein [Hyphomicrobiaceae bacterium]